jgi:flagellar hook-length control protein FliK
MTGPSSGAAPTTHSTAAAASGQAPGAAALALLSRTGKAGKTPGKTGLAGALEASTTKGKASFLDLVTSLSAKKNKPGAQDAALALTALAAKAAGAGSTARGTAGAAPLADAAENATAGKAALHDDRTVGKKKASPAPGPGSVGFSLLALLPSDGPKQPTAKPAAAEAATDLKTAATTAQAAQRSSEPVVRVIDLRSKAKPGTSSEGTAAAKVAPQAGQGDKDPGTAFAQKIASFHDTTGAGVERAAPSAASAAHSPAPLDRLREMAGSELLKATNLVLKDGGGEIRLVLKPESLGSVRIRMNMVDNKIEGRIVVDNSTVKAVFDANMDALRRALTAEGFNTGSLQVSVGGQNTDADRRKEQQPPEAVRRITAQGFERNVPGAETMSLGDLLVNLFV